jgi:hypothetical protein
MWISSGEAKFRNSNRFEWEFKIIKSRGDVEYKIKWIKTASQRFIIKINGTW